MGSPITDVSEFVRKGGEEYSSYAGIVAAVTVNLLGLMTLIDLPWSISLLHCTAQCILLFTIGVLCLVCETKLSHSYHSALQENCGFVLKPHGRACAYGLTAVYCFGARAATVQAEIEDNQGYSMIFSFFWDSCCLLTALGSFASLWTARTYERQNYMVYTVGGLDTDYYISS